jgi:hypothetical protein
VLRLVEFAEGIDEADDSGMDQVFQRHVAGQVFVNPACEVAHLRKLFHQDALPLGLGLQTAVGMHGVLAHKNEPSC